MVAYGKARSEIQPNRNHKRRQRTRDAIVAAAERIFRAKGVSGATVNEITEEADVAYGSFYNHFKTIDDVVAAVAETKIDAIGVITGQLLAKAERVETLPSIGARVIMRTLTQDATIRWLLERPYIFVAEWYKLVGPFMREAERQAVQDGTLTPAGGHEAWLRDFPWLLIAELNHVFEKGGATEHEERFARISSRLLGIEESLIDGLLKESDALVTEAGLTPRASGKKPRRAATPSA